MNLARCRVAVLAAVAVAASIFAYAPTAAAQTASQGAGGHQVSIDALDKYGYQAGVEMFAGTGCAGSDELCPEEPVLRWEIAVWLVRIIDGANPTAARSSRYDDVDADAWWAPHAERLADLGIDLSCGPDQLCPHEPMDRGQMAGFLVRILDLPRAGTAAFVDVSADHPHVDDNRPARRGQDHRGMRDEPGPLLPRPARHPGPDGHVPGPGAVHRSTCPHRCRHRIRRRCRSTRRS